MKESQSDKVMHMPKSHQVLADDWLMQRLLPSGMNKDENIRWQ
jgi:hypothetical protein